MKLAELDGYIFKQATNFVDMTSEHKTFKHGDSLWSDRMTGRTHERRQIYRSVCGTAKVQLKVFLAVLKRAVCYHLFALLTFSSFCSSAYVSLTICPPNSRLGVINVRQIKINYIFLSCGDLMEQCVLQRG